MKIVRNGSVYRLYKGDVQVLEKIPAQTYIVRYSKQEGFYLEQYAELNLREQKVYGTQHEVKREKVLKRFKNFTRNYGIILSGDKGIGKSLFVRMLSQVAVKQGYPVIVVDEYVQGLHAFIEEIEQEVVVLFDEFDKKFSNEDGGAQSTLLSLLDGLSNGKKMFVITCNEFRKLSEYMINRPGRFHFHIRFGYPSAEEIMIYLKDNLNEDYWDEIPKIISFASKVPLNYDCLRAIAFEIQQGETFESAIEDLNILNTETARYNVVLRFDDGTVLSGYDKMDLFDSKVETVYLYSSDEDTHVVKVRFAPTAASYDVTSGNSIIKPGNFKIEYNERDATKEDIEKIKQLQPVQLEIVREKPKNIHYEF